MDYSLKEVAGRIKGLREAKGYTQEELAKLTGVSVEDYRRVISLGISKINYYTYMSKAGAEAVVGKTFTQYHDIVKAATEGMRIDVENAIRVFSGL